MDINNSLVCVERQEEVGSDQVEEADPSMGITRSRDTREGECRLALEVGDLVDQEEVDLEAAEVSHQEEATTRERDQASVD